MKLATIIVLVLGCLWSFLTGDFIIPLLIISPLIIASYIESEGSENGRRAR